MSKILALIDALSEEEKKCLSICEFKKDEIIHYIDENCESIEILLNGEIIMSNLDIDGKEETFNYFKAPSIFGNNLIFSSQRKYLSNVISATSSTICRISKNALLNILQSNADFLNKYMNLIADKSLEINQRLRIIAIQNTDKRLMSFLKLKFKENNGKYVINSITNFAKELSLPRETTSRAIYKLARAQKFQYSNKVFKEIKNALDSI